MAHPGQILMVHFCLGLCFTGCWERADVLIMWADACALKDNDDVYNEVILFETRPKTSHTMDIISELQQMFVVVLFFYC